MAQSNAVSAASAWPARWPASGASNPTLSSQDLNFVCRSLRCRLFITFTRRSHPKVLEDRLLALHSKIVHYIHSQIVRYTHSKFFKGSAQSSSRRRSSSKAIFKPKAILKGSARSSNKVIFKGSARSSNAVILKGFARSSNNVIYKQKKRTISGTLFCDL